MVEVVSNELAVKTNCGANKNFPTLNDTLGCPRIRHIDTGLVKMLPLNDEPSFSNFLTYKIYAKYGGAYSFGDIILAHGHEYTVKPVLIEKVTM